MNKVLQLRSSLWGWDTEWKATIDLGALFPDKKTHLMKVLKQFILNCHDPEQALTNMRDFLIDAIDEEKNDKKREEYKKNLIWIEQVGEKEAIWKTRSTKD